MEGHILLVDDEPAIRLFLGDELAQAGYSVQKAACGEDALEILRDEDVDLVILDLRLGDMDGLRMMAEMEDLSMPPEVVMLTAYADLNSAIEVMRRGGYDYLTKPCHPEDLLNSIERGMTRRREKLRQQELLNLISNSAQQLLSQSDSWPSGQSSLLAGRGLTLDMDRLWVARNGQPVRLTLSEFHLLACLMAKEGQIVSYRELVQVLHGHNVELEDGEASQAVRTHLWRLRKKIGNGPNNVPYIMNVKKQGYRFVGGGGEK